MSSVSAVNQDLLLQQLSSQTGSSSTQAPVQANDAFAQLFQQILGTQNQSDPMISAQSASSSTTTASASTSSADMTALGQALSAGNISAAQQAFQALQSDLALEGTTKTHHHHHHAQESATESGTTSAASASTAASTAASTTASTTAADASGVPAVSGSNASQIMSLLLGMI